MAFEEKHQADTGQVNQEAADVQRSIEAALGGGMTQSTLAKQAGLSGPVVSQWLKGVYRGDNAGVQGKLSAWLASQRADTPNADAGRLRWVDTPTSQAITRALTFARVRPAIAAVYGGAGVGKTTTLTHYAQTFPNVWIVTASPSRSSMAAMLREIGAALELQSGGWQNRALSRDIIHRLSGTRGLLVIDEAQHLSLQALEEVRSIHDAAQVGLVLNGNESVYARLTGGSRRADFAQLFSRVGRKVKIGMPTTEDVNAILSAWGVSGAKEREYAHQIASMPGGLRGLVNTLDEAALAAQGMGQALDVRMLRMAWGELGSVQ